MTKIRVLTAVFLVMAVLATGLVPLVAEALPPTQYLCTVFIDGVPADAGAHVECFLGSSITQKAEAYTGVLTTNPDNFCLIQASIALEEVNEALRFTVDGIDAIETPDVDFTQGCTNVRLDITTTGSCEWQFPFGILTDPPSSSSAVFPRTYVCPADLDLSTATPPAEVNVVWFYDENVPEWLFWTGWPESTLETLQVGKIYDVIVLYGCTWVLQ